MNDLLLAEIDLPGLPFCPLPSAHQPASEIVKDGLWRDAERCRGALNRIGPIGPARRGRAHPVDLHRRDAPALAQQPDVLAFEGAAPRRDETLPVKRRRDLLVHLAGAVERRDALMQLLEIAVIAVGVDAPLHAMLAGGAGLPHDLEPDLAGNALLIEGHLAHDKAQQALALGRGGRRRMPYSRQVLAQDLQPSLISIAQDERLCAAPLLVFLCDRFYGAQLLFPGPFQRACHQPVLGLDRVVLAPGSLGLVAGALAPQRPLLLQSVRFLLQLPESGDSNGDPVGCEGVEKRALDEGIDGESAHFLAQRAGLVVAVGAAAIDRIIALRAGVAQAHAPPAAPAHGNAL